MSKKRIVKPLSIDIAPNSKKAVAGARRLNLITTTPNRKMISIRMRPEMINSLNDICKKVSRRTKHKYSQSAVIEMALAIAKKTDIRILIDYYAETLKF